MCRTRVIIQLSQRGRLDRRGILNSADDLLNLPLRQQSAFDVFLDHALLIDEHAPTRCFWFDAFAFSWPSASFDPRESRVGRRRSFKRLKGSTAIGVLLQ